jgi:class 3 adenylate cyclase
VSDTARTQTVFLDIVGFTRNRSVEAQSDVVAAMNALVSKAMDDTQVPASKVILLPTGDGIAIALIEVTGVDAHLRLALEIVRLVAERNASEADAMRRFEVRIGINENVDNIVTDINGRRNVAGAGISTAQRIMDKADGGQILVGQTVYEVLRQRERYLSSFRAFRARGKHGLEFDVYQFLSKDAFGLSVATPSAFASGATMPRKLTKFAAYYLAHAIVNLEFLASQRGNPSRDSTAVVLLSLLAEDSVEASETPPHEEPFTKTWGAGTASVAEQFVHYDEIDLTPLLELAELLADQRLAHYSGCFEGDMFPNYAFVSATGIEKLRRDWPQIAEEFGIDSPDESS